MIPLYKTTITVWSTYNPSGVSLSDLVANGDELSEDNLLSWDHQAVVSHVVASLVPDPEVDDDWDDCVYSILDDDVDESLDDCDEYDDEYNEVYDDEIIPSTEDEDVYSPTGDC